MLIFPNSSLRSLEESQPILFFDFFLPFSAIRLKLKKNHQEVRGGKKIPGYAESVRRIRLKKSN
jgi:hypothetical protein